MPICILYLFKNLYSILKRDKRNHHVSFVYLQSKEEERSLFLKDSGHFMEQMTSYKKDLNTEDPKGSFAGLVWSVLSGMLFL